MPDDLVIAVQQLDPELPLPAYAHPGDAGADLVAGVDVDLMFLEARLLLERIAGAHALAAPHRSAHAAALAAATDDSRPVEARLAVLTGPEAVAG